MALLERQLIRSLQLPIWKGLASASVILAMSLAGRVAVAQDNEVEEPLDTRVYPVVDLVLPVTSYDYQSTGVPTLGLGGLPRAGIGMGGMGGGMMGGMGGGMGGMGGAGGQTSGFGGMGGGFFNVYEQVLAQRGGSAEGGSAAVRAPANFDSLIDAITSTIDVNTWEGGDTAIVPLGGTLIVTQTPTVHKKIDKLLKDIRAAGQNQRTVTLRATWLLLTSEQLASIEANLGDQRGGGAVDRAAFSRLAAKVYGYQGQITCFDNQTVHLVAGRGRTAIVGAIPVVGSGAAYQPIVAFPQSGAVLQVTPYVAADSQTAVLDVHSTVIEAGEPEPQAPFLAVGESGEKGEDGAPGTLNLDRINLLAQQLRTTLRVKIDTPILIGGLSREPGTGKANAGQDPQLYLFVETSSKDFGK